MTQRFCKKKFIFSEKYKLFRLRETSSFSKLKWQGEQLHVHVDSLKLLMSNFVGDLTLIFIVAFFRADIIHILSVDIIYQNKWTQRLDGKHLNLNNILINSLKTKLIYFLILHSTRRVNSRNGKRLPKSQRCSIKFYN